MVVDLGDATVSTARRIVALRVHDVRVQAAFVSEQAVKRTQARRASAGVGGQRAEAGLLIDGDEAGAIERAAGGGVVIAVLLVPGVEVGDLGVRGVGGEGGPEHPPEDAECGGEHQQPEGVALGVHFRSLTPLAARPAL